jgi:hypothetical protein
MFDRSSVVTKVVTIMVTVVVAKVVTIMVTAVVAKVVTITVTVKATMVVTIMVTVVATKVVTIMVTRVVTRVVTMTVTLFPPLPPLLAQGMVSFATWAEEGNGGREGRVEGASVKWEHEMPESTSLNQRLLELAQRVAREFRNDPRVDAMMLTGSVAIGCGDRGSDLDIILYLNTPLGEEEFEGHKRLARESGGGFYFGTAEGFAVYRRVNGVKVDLGFGTTAETETLLASVLDHHSTDAVQHQVIAGLLESVPLHGHERLAGWCARVLPMPRDLQIALLRENLRITPLSILEAMAANRDDRLFWCESVLAIQTRMLKLLYTLDGCYFPGKLKGLRYRMEGLEHGLHDRLCRQLSGPMDEGLRDLADWVPRVLDRVGREFPEVETGPALEFFHSDIRQWG